jgi:MFS family permease
MPLRSGADKNAAANGELVRRLHGWRHPAILAAAGLSFMSGFAQFLTTTTLPDVARAFGERTAEGGSIAAQAGLSATTLGLGLAIIRLASLAALPLSGFADRRGRRRVILTTTAVGLAFTASAALSPGFWWFVAAVAAGRPLLSATNAVAGVIAAEETRTKDRAWAIALTIAGYGSGAGSTALLRGIFSDLGFRPMFALALVLLLLLPLLGRAVEEPARFDRLAERAAVGPSLLRRIPRGGELGRRFRVLAATYFAVTFLTGPVNTFLFLFGENILGMPRSATAFAVISVGPIGALGLLLGRFASDRLGRIPTSVVGQALIAVAGIVVYSGSVPGVIVGYFTTILFGSMLGPAVGALSAELFPTSVRSTVAGAMTAVGVISAVLGLVVFGVLADALGSFGLAAWVIGLPVVASSPLYLLLPETRHLELEQSAPEEDLPQSPLG